MSKNVITAAEDVPLEEAARIMADRGIGGLPIMRGSSLVGVITESDLFRVFIELFGARQKGIRISLTVPNVKGELARVSAAVTNAGGNILALGTFLGEDPGVGRVTMKVDGMARDALVGVLTPMAKSIDDVRET
jgi:acetoin utilization protein AcuB